MKKSTAWILWSISAIASIFGLVKMFLGSEYWILYALIVGLGFYFTRTIFKKHLAR